MSWTNPPVALYHGTIYVAAAKIAEPSDDYQHSIDLSLSAALTDFGRGFYLTTSLHQAKNWANTRYHRSGAMSEAAVMLFEVDRDELAALEDLWFVLEGSGPDYWSLVESCRAGGEVLRPDNGEPLYDVVLGPVSLWEQRLVIKDCDQVGFHTEKALSVLPTPTIHDRGSPTFPM